MADPVRTCVGCRRRAPQSELLRMTLTGDGPLVVSRTAPGRGAWLCAASAVDCLEAAAKRHAVPRALRATVGSEALAALVGELRVRIAHESEGGTLAG